MFGLFGGTDFSYNLRVSVITISSGIFTGAVVTLLISIKEYLYERKKALLNIYSELFDIQNAFMSIKPFIPEVPVELVAECLRELDSNSLFEELNTQLAENKADVKPDCLFTCSYSAKEKYKYAMMSNMTNEWIAELKTLYNLNEVLEHEYTRNMEKYTKELGDSIDSYIEFENLSNKDLAMAIEELDFIFSNNTIKRRYEKLNYRILNVLSLIHNRINTFKSYHEKGASKATYCHLVNEIQNKLFVEDEEKVYHCLSFIIYIEMKKILLMANGKKPNLGETDMNGFIIHYKPHKYGR